MSGVIRVDDNRIINESDVTSSEASLLRVIEDFSSYVMPNGETAEEYFQNVIVDLNETPKEELDIFDYSSFMIDSIMSRIINFYGESPFNEEEINELIVDLVQDAVAQIPPPKDGESVSIEDVKPLISQLVQDAVAQIPPPKDGKDGKSVTVEDVKPIITDLVVSTVEAIPKPKDGKSVTLDDITPVIDELIKSHVSKIPKPKDGKSVTVEDVLPIISDLVNEVVSKIPKPKKGADGKSVTVEDVLPIIAEIIEREIENKKPPALEYTFDGGRIGIRHQGEERWNWTPDLRGRDGFGIPGNDGLSAYQIWRKKGYTGNEQDFLNWLRGGGLRRFDVDTDNDGCFEFDFSFLNLENTPPFSITPWLSDESTDIKERIVTFSIERINNDSIKGYAFRRYFRPNLLGMRNPDSVPAKNNKITIVIGV